MICKMGKNKRNAFIIFIDEQKDKVPEWRKKPMKVLVSLCKPLWEDLSSEEKEEYKEKQRQERRLTLFEERELESTGGQSTEQERKEVRKKWRFDEDGNRLADDTTWKVRDRYTGYIFCKKVSFLTHLVFLGGLFVKSSGISAFNLTETKNS